MSRVTVTVHVNGLGLTEFAADNFSFDIADQTVTMTCAVPNTQIHPVTLDPQVLAALGIVVTNPDGKPATWADRMEKLQRDARNTLGLDQDAPPHIVDLSGE